MGCGVGRISIASGFSHQGRSPSRAIRVAVGQAFNGSVLFSQPLVPFGTILQLVSDLMASARPLSYSMRKPKSMPAAASELNALTAKTCLPGDSNKVKLYS